MAKNNYLECAHEVGSICRFGVVGRGVVINDVSNIFGMLEQLVEFSAVFPSFAKVERAKILVEWLILKILHVNKCTLSILK